MEHFTFLMTPRSKPAYSLRLPNTFASLLDVIKSITRSNDPTWNIYIIISTLISFAGPALICEMYLCFFHNWVHLIFLHT